MTKKKKDEGVPHEKTNENYTLRELTHGGGYAPPLKSSKRGNQDW